MPINSLMFISLARSLLYSVLGMILENILSWFDVFTNSLNNPRIQTCFS